MDTTRTHESLCYEIDSIDDNLDHRVDHDNDDAGAGRSTDNKLTTYRVEEDYLARRRRPSALSCLDTELHTRGLRVPWMHANCPLKIKMNTHTHTH
jgi:hypothetical protein